MALTKCAKMRGVGSRKILLALKKPDVTAIDEILKGIEAEFALERELGVRTIEIDRALLSPSLKKCDQGEKTKKEIIAPLEKIAPLAAAKKVLPRQQEDQKKEVQKNESSDIKTAQYNFVFLHHAPLSPGADEIMSKIITAMGKTREQAPILVSKPLLPARAYVVLGACALRYWFPSSRASFETWFNLDNSTPVLMTHSPEEFCRFSTVSPAMLAMKQGMWKSLKVVMQRTEER